MSQKHQKSQVRSLSVNAIAEKPLLIWDYVAFAAIAVFCFLVFQQSDLLHTAGCSYGYLNGHFRDFYDYCGTFDIHPAYMPSFYLIFAIWNIPMRLFGVVTFPTEFACSCYFMGKAFAVSDLCGKRRVDLSHCHPCRNGQQEIKALCICMPYYASCFLCTVYLWSV